MGVKATNAVWEHSKHKGSPLLVLLAIADFANDQGEAWPSIETLHKKSRLSERQVIRVVEKVEGSGELKVKHRRNTGNHYIILLKGLSDNLSLRESDRGGDKESVIDLPDPESQLLTDTAESVITDTVMSDDPSLTVKEPSLRNARVKGATATQEKNSEDSRDNAGGEKQGDENIYKWLEDKKQAEIKSGVRPPAEEKIDKLPRTAEDIKAGVHAAVLENAARNEKENNDPAIESYLATVPEHVRKLARVFLYHKMRPPLKTENAMWRREWQDQFDIGLSAKNVSDAIEYMGQNNLGVRSPMSTLTIAENIRLKHIVLDKDRDVKSSEVSYDLPSPDQVDTVSEPEVSPMDKLIEEKTNSE